MNWLLLLKTIHIVAAITAVGSNLTYGAWSARAQRSPEHLGFALRGIKFIDDRIANPAYGVILVTGLLMAVLYVGFHLWVFLGLGLFIAVALVGVAFYSPLLKRQIALLDSEGSGGAAYKATDARAGAVGIFLAVVVIAIVFIMVFKPQ